jgi:hypothetical protein
MQKVTADFPQQLCDQIGQLECMVSPRYNPSIWLLGCDKKEEIRTQHPCTSQLLYPCCVAEIFSRLPVQTGQLENIFQARPLLQSFTNLLLQIKRVPPQTLWRNVGPGQYINACSGVESGGDRHILFQITVLWTFAKFCSAPHTTVKMQIRLKLQLNFRITCNEATQETSNEGQAMHNIIFPDEFSMQY